MPTLRVLDASGDRHITWSLTAFDRGDTEAQSAVREAERIFAEERRRGASAFRIASGAPAQRIDEFDQRADEIILIPQMVGG